jgi:hypothetical protein
MSQTLAVSVIVPARTLSKQVLQYTGRSLRGANGTTAWPPQWPQIAAWNSRGPPTVRARLATARQEGHRCGSFNRPLLEKKACSPLENTNSPAQSRQVRVRSWNTLSRSSWCGPIAPVICRGPPRRTGLFTDADRRARADGSTGLGPGTHVAENSRGVKGFSGSNLAPKSFAHDEIRGKHPDVGRHERPEGRSRGARTHQGPAWKAGTARDLRTSRGHA